MHPRQQLDLSGAWQIAFDPENRGLASGWASGQFPRDSLGIQVPAIWNIEYPDAEGVGFYRTLFLVPGDWRDQVVQLHFQGASYRVEAWLNQNYVGSHEGAYTPFWFDVTPFVRCDSENELIVRVAALSRTKAVDGMILQHAPASKQSWYYAYGGLWGNVRLETRPWVACQSLAVEPDLARESALVEVALNNRLAECRAVDLRLEITAPDNRLAFEQASAVMAVPGVSRFSFRVLLSRPFAWSCEHPQLYRVRATTSDDEVAAQFGMRDFTVQDGEFFLNGEPVFLRGILLQPNYPINLVTPPNREMMVREITLAKEAGFNLIRAHIRPAPPGFLDLTDQMGMLVYAENCLAWIKDSPRITDHGRRQVQALIERDRNHPSVVFWGIYNENRQSNAINGEALVHLARALDPTRVIVDNSGGTMAIDQDFGWIDRATMVPNRENERQKILDVHLYLGGLLPGPVYEWMRALGSGAPSAVLATQDFGSTALFEEFDREQRSYRGKVFVSELGYGGMADLDDLVAGFQGRENLLDARELKIFRDDLHNGFEARHLDRVFGSVHNLALAAQELHADANTRQIQALLTNPRISGYVLTQLNDVAWEFHAGLLDLWRNPKPAYYAAKRLNLPHCLVLKAASPVATLGETINVSCTVVSRLPLGGNEQVVVTVYDPTGARIASEVRRVAAGMGIKELGAISFKTTDTAGEYRVSARWMQGEQILAQSSETVLALPLEPTEENDERLLIAANPAALFEKDWEALFTHVETGGAAIVGPLHKRDEIALRALASHGLDIKLNLAIGSWMGCNHWQHKSPLFEGLPCGGLAGEPYVDVLPWYGLSELGGEVLAGSLRNTQTRLEAPAIVWYSDIERVRVGKGSVVFCQYRVFDKMKINPLAARLVRNLVREARGDGEARI
ncbi:MAG: beta galactosidase jelly roll domain-containing protein [Chloroflexi bacterium]|nr:beta galactosidase jelly roll domain-containing protein [Chloroflexota bacterium]